MRYILSVYNSDLVKNVLPTHLYLDRTRRTERETEGSSRGDGKEVNVPSNFVPRTHCVTPWAAEDQYTRLE